MIEGHEMKTHKAVSSKKKRGFTLTEIAIVLGIIGLILGAIWVAAAAVYNNMRVAHADTQILQLAQGIRALYSSTNSDTGMTVDNIVCTKAAPSDMIVNACGSPGTLNDAFPNGVTTVAPTTDYQGFVFSMTGVSRANCDNLLMQAAGASRDPGLFQANAVAGNFNATSVATGAPLNFSGNQSVPTIADAEGSAVTGFGGCSSIAGSATGTVVFGFTLR